MSDLSKFSHDHIFGGTPQKIHERRTRIVIGLTATMMVLEVASGLLFGSMALLADGWHMASHAAALSITAFGYFFARRYASDPRFSFGTGKIGELAGYSSALLLAFIAILMAYESITRLYSPVKISFDEAIAVAVLGLIVNLVSALVLRDRSESGSSHRKTDYNLRAAYLHVLADALTSVLAIVALTTGRFLGWVWMDPMMGIVGAVVISRWSYTLLRDTSRVLLDMDIHGSLSEKIRRRIESESDSRVADLHVWRIGPGSFAAIVSVVTDKMHTAAYFKTALSHFHELCHVTVEVNPAKEPPASD